MTKTMRKAAGALVLASAFVACARGGSDQPTPRRELVGEWHLVTVNGAALPTPSPEEPNVMLESVVMTLESSGAYSLASAFRIDDQPSQSVTIRGTWVAADDALTFENEGGNGPAIVMFGYRMDEGILRMVDEQEHEWAMRRN